jgi:hypothetical protein
VKIIFLDFDGVLNHAKTPAVDGLLPLDPRCVDILNRLLGHEITAFVVISSSWRIGRELHQLRDILVKAGLKLTYASRLLGVTQQTQFCRGNEIQTWLNSMYGTPDSILILDDDSDMGPLKPYLLQTSLDTGGLREDHLSAAIEMLGRPFKPPLSITQILLDMDGVIADFTGHAITTLGYSAEEIYSKWIPGHYELFEMLGIKSEKVFWDQINHYGHEWWSSIPRYTWADMLWDMLEGVAPVTILTSPSRSPNAPKGKVRWLLDWKGPNFRSYMIGPQKYLCARDGALLIDDSEHKVRKFVAHGGRAILFPRLWNSNHEHTARAFQFVKDSLGDGEFYEHQKKEEVTLQG